jgi:hypothetical protein
MNGVIQPEKSPYAESVEGESCESLSSSSIEGSDECVKQEDSCLRKDLSVTYNHCLNEVSSIKQGQDTFSINIINSVDAYILERFQIGNLFGSTYSNLFTGISICETV